MSRAPSRRVLGRRIHCRGRSPGRGPCLLALALVAAWALGCAPGERVRVVLITLDTLRFDDFMGSDEQPTAMPLLRQRSEQGTLFLHFHAAGPLTQPSHASMFTGLHPWQHGITRNGQVLAPGFETLAEALGRAGFATVAVVASFPVAGRFGFQQGFDHYVEDFTHDFLQMTSWEGQPLPSREFYSTAETVTDHALAALDSAEAAKQFFWFHYFDPHAPYGSSLGENVTKISVFAELRRDATRRDELLRRVRTLYRADVSSLDRSLDRLLARLAAESERFRTHVMIVSDHGESIGEGDSLGHGSLINEAEIRVPALLLSPDVAPGLRDDTAGSVDVAPTLMRLAGLEPPATGSGRDLTGPAAGAPTAYGMRRTFARSPAYEGRLDGRDHLLPDLEFYSVHGAGPYTVGNAGGVSAADAEQAAEARARFRDFERALSEQAAIPIDEDVSRALEALGYAP